MTMILRELPWLQMSFLVLSPHAPCATMPSNPRIAYPLYIRRPTKEKLMVDRIRRSWLLVPAHDDARLGEAAHVGADVIVLDLQDMVHDTQKHVARARVRDTIPRLCAQGVEVFVRADIELLYA